jgi:hydroxyacylglutathione hydrolase
MMPAATYKLHRIGLTHVSCYLIYRPGEAILVDCGNGGSEDRIMKALQARGLEPGMLRLLILTHEHFDHAGSAARVKEITGCKVMIHRSAEERLRKGFSPIPGGTRWKAKIVVGAGRIFARGLMHYPGTEPDLLVDELFDLEEFGFPGSVIHVPGHTISSMVVLMNGGELVGGDTLFGLENKQHFPPFAEDLPALVRSWEKLRGLRITDIYPAHGHTFSFESFLSEYEAAMKRYG